MDYPRSSSGNGEDNVGIPEDLRCKRSDGKQWRCSAMSMPDKTVCEKHYIQAKKRAANSALRASLKKAKRRPFDDSDVYLEGKNDDEDSPFLDTKGGEFSASVSGKRYKEKVPKSQARYSPESPHLRSLSTHNPLRLSDDRLRDGDQFDEDRRSSHKTPSSSAMDLSRSKTQNFDADSPGEDSDGSTDSSDEDAGLTCHQCRRNDSGRVIWCQKCDKRGYCDKCISKWYPDISLEETQKVCPACRGTCNCKACLRGDNLVKLQHRMREIPVSNKLHYLYQLLSSVLPVVKEIHSSQRIEQELETKLNGTKTDIPRAKLHADEQMCCNCCRIPIIDYHRHCSNCLYDLCLVCSRDLRQVNLARDNGESIECKGSQSSDDGAAVPKQPRSMVVGTSLTDCFTGWKANADGSISCPPKDSGGCGCSSLILRRIFKMNWVAKLVKIVEEMVKGCKVYDVLDPQSSGVSNVQLCQFANREDDDDNFIYCPTSQEIEIEGVGSFQKHWVRGEPVIVKHVYDCESCSNWDPMVIWRGIQETSAEKMRETTVDKMDDVSRTVKAIDCLDGSEVDIELGQFIKGYTEGRIHENGWPEMLKLKDWPSPAATEEFLLYQRPEFISKLPLLEYIHSKWGLLNVAAKLPNYSLQSDVGPKILMSYGAHDELGRGDSVINLHTNMRDMVYLLIHTFEVKLKGWQRTKIEKLQKTFGECSANESFENAQAISTGEGGSLGILSLEHSEPNDCRSGLSAREDDTSKDQFFDRTELASGSETIGVGSGLSERNGGEIEKVQAGAIWDIFRRQDVPKIMEYLTSHSEEFRKPVGLITNQALHPIHSKVVFLNRDHKMTLKEEFGIEPWTFEQHLGEAVFIPAGCLFQVRNLQSSVQLALDFLSPESLRESVRLTEEIRGLPKDHEAKVHMLEVGKMSLYAASSATKEVEKLSLDAKVAVELGFDDPNLTSAVSENLQKMIQRRQMVCT